LSEALDPRAELGLRWSIATLGRSALQLQAASTDASARRYLPLLGAEAPLLLMDSPPEQVPLRPWLHISDVLRTHGLRVPQVIATDPAQGFALIEHLGDRVLLSELIDAQQRKDMHTVDAHYQHAMDTIFSLQSRIAPECVPDYDAVRLSMELELMPTWFLQRHLGMTLSSADRHTLEGSFHRLIDSALCQPQVFVHRDFHARNLIPTDDGLALIDFQDALRGAFTYDLVSLLRDCYVRWPVQNVHAWAESFRLKWLRSGRIADEPADFHRAFDWMGLQRHLKVLGIFCRLHYRDGKASYLKDLPRVLGYVLEVTECWPEFAALHALMLRATARVDLTAARQP
jgi:aminoglycoside/choline kinase family phosphotransferase